MIFRSQGHPIQAWNYPSSVTLQWRVVLFVSERLCEWAHASNMHNTRERSQWKYNEIEWISPRPSKRLAKHTLVLFYLI